MLPVLILCTALSVPPDNSRAYFTGLQRPHADSVDFSAGDGPVILIVVDAMRPDHMTPYGAANDTTPNLKRLADEGLVLTNYFVNGNWTRPTTATLLTGLPPILHRVERDQDKLAHQFVTLAEVLGDAGVPTGAVVGNGNAGSAFGLGRGFDFYADTVKHWQGLPSAAQVTELAIPFVRKHLDGRFFLMLFFVDPHDPYHAPAPYEKMFDGNSKARLVRSPHWELGHYTPAEIARMTATYDGAVRYTDTVIGEFFDDLRDLGIYDRATILVTSDHGEAFGEHGVFLHAHHFYDEIVRAPLIIKAPVMDVRGIYSHYLFQTIDLLPTIAGLFGAPTRTDLPGVDIARNLLEPSRNNPRRSIVSEFNNFGIRRRMIRTYRRKIIYQEPADEAQFLATVGKRSLLPSVSFDEERIQAFYVDADPFERRDVYSPERMQMRQWRGLLSEIKAYHFLPDVGGVPTIVGRIDPEVYRDLEALGYVR